MKFIKHIALGLVAGGMLSVSSCTNLDETLYSKLNESNLDFTNPIDIALIQGQAIAQYRYLHESWFGLFHHQELVTDLYCTPFRIGIGWGDIYVAQHKHTWDYNEGMCENQWGYAYSCIGYCNRTLDALPEDDIDNRSQVRFFRAMTYWHLLDLFRNVPLLTTMDLPDGYVPEQKKAQDIYDFCVSEFNDIKEPIGTNKVFGYGNKYTVCMALAKLYLNKNVYLGTTDNDGYEAAIKEVETVINEGGYSLAPNYLDNFRENISSSTEVIFAIPGDRTHAVNFNLHTYLVPQVGLEAYGSTATATNGSCGVPQFMDTYDADDTRFTDSWASGLQHYAVKNADGTYTPNAGDPIPYDEDDWAGQEKLNYNRNVHSIDGAYKQEGYRLHKYEIVGGSDKGTSANDLCIFRLADAMFIKAECLLRLGRDEEIAASLVSEVRERAFPSAATKAIRKVADLKGGSVYSYGHEEYTGKSFSDWGEKVTTHEGGADIILGGLLDDLAWEFCAEEHRRQDLIRFKMTDGRSVFTGKSWFCKDAGTDDHWEVFPIPEEAIRTNLTLVQNPGYTGATK